MRSRIAIFQQDLRSGGAERMMLNLARDWSDRGIGVDLVLVNRSGVYLPLVPSRVRVVDLQCQRTSTSVAALARYLWRERPAAVLSALVHINIVAIMAKKLCPRDTRLVISERNTPSQDSRDPERATRIGYRLAPYLYPYADAITAVSSGVADDLAKFARIPRERILAINNPVVTDDTLRLAREPFPHRWLGPGLPPVILCVGRLSKAKDYPTMLKAFAMLRQTVDCRLLILGDGPLKPELEMLASRLRIADDVEFAGFVINPYAAMSKANLLVLSSRWEGSPNVLVEAMACGLQVVSTDCPSGPCETLAMGQYGTLVPVGDMTTLAAAMKSALRNPKPAVLLQRRAQAYSASRAADQYLSILLGWPGSA